jgi:hypothetical protein
MDSCPRRMVGGLLGCDASVGCSGSVLARADDLRARGTWWIAPDLVSIELNWEWSSCSPFKPWMPLHPSAFLDAIPRCAGYNNVQPPFAHTGNTAIGWVSARQPQPSGSHSALHCSHMRHVPVTTLDAVQPRRYETRLRLLGISDKAGWPLVVFFCF